MKVQTVYALSSHALTFKAPITKSCMFLLFAEQFRSLFKDKDYCPIEIIKGLTDKGQFQYLTKLMGPQEGTYLYETQFHSLR